MTVCFEVSFEVCNKIGGIYTVISSKTKYMKKHYKDNYFAIGYYVKEKAESEFKEEELPNWIKEYDEFFRSQGIIIHYGRWLKGNDVKTILIDSEEFKKMRVNDIKGELWKLFKIDSLNSGDDFNTPVAWAYAAGKVIEKLSSKIKDKIVVHSHEWLAGVCNLYLRSKGFDKGLVFTSHATVLGRTYASVNPDNPIIDSSQPIDELVYRYNIQAKHLTEKESAKNSNVFTTVSEITAKEAEIVLGIKPQLITYNALDFSKIPQVYELTAKEMENREKLNNFLKFYFLPYYQFDINNSFVIMTSGRHEFKGKGIDIFIDALFKMNEYLKKTKSKKHIIALIFVPSDFTKRNDEIRRNYNKFHFIEDEIESKMDNLYKKIIDCVVYSKNPTKEILSKEFINDVEILSQKFKIGKKKPPISAFDLKEKDDILNKIESSELDNGEEDKVKIVYYPCYVTKDDNLIEMTYPEIVNACDMAIFPSRYEPWGYTPIEAAAHLTLSITSNLSGCGKYILSKFKGSKGISVVNIDNNAAEEIKNIVVENMFLNEKELLTKKITAREISESLDWKVQIKNYIKAHRIALR